MADQRAESSASRPPSDSSDAVHAELDTKPRREGAIPEIETDDAPVASGGDGGSAEGGPADGASAEQAVEAVDADQVPGDPADAEPGSAKPGSAKPGPVKSEHPEESASSGSMSESVESEPAEPEPAEPKPAETDGTEFPEAALTSTDVDHPEPPTQVEPEPAGSVSAEPEAVDSEPAEDPVEGSVSGAEEVERAAAEGSGQKNNESRQDDEPPERTENHERTDAHDPETWQRPNSQPYPVTATFDPMRADTLTMHAVATEAGRAQADDDAEARRRRRIRLTSILAAATFGLAGFLAVTSAVNAKGTDLRAERQTDVADLARAQLRTNRELDARLAKLRGEVDELLARQLRNDNAGAAQKKVDELAPAAGLTPLVGPGVTVVLDDAPPSVRSDDTDPDALVVHQQDIQAVVNAMWAGGAEAMMIQGQRVISTSAIRCVGNSVVLHGVPYPPPYRIEAIGNVSGMVQAINDSPAVNTYLEYVADPRYRLGWQLDRSSQLRVPAFEGSLKLDHAEERDVSPGQDSDD